MSAQNIPLIQAYQVPAANTKVYTAQALTRIDAATLFNPTGNAACVITVSIVPLGGSVGAPNLIASRNCLPGIGVSLFEIIGQSLNDGDMIYAQAATGNLVNLFMSGLQSS